MQLKPECFVCLFNQALRVTKVLECSEECAKEVLEEVAGSIATLSFSLTPPEAAAITYPLISQKLSKVDLYEEIKEESTQKALGLLKRVKEQIESSDDPLDSALRAAVAGNVIDFATEVLFDLEEEFEKIFEASFAIDEKEQFLKRLGKAKRLVVIGDNVGEHLFDKMMLETFKKNYLDLEIFYFVRGKPIINDVTMKEALEIGMDDVAAVIDSGVDTPGFMFDRASKEAQNIYQDADLVLAKGMGNFECMESNKDSRVYFLFKVKCLVVASTVGANVGDLICKGG